MYPMRADVVNDAGERRVPSFDDCDIFHFRSETRRRHAVGVVVLAIGPCKVLANYVVKRRRDFEQHNTDGIGWICERRRQQQHL